MDRILVKRLKDEGPRKVRKKNQQKQENNERILKGLQLKGALCNFLVLVVLVVETNNFAEPKL